MPPELFPEPTHMPKTSAVLEHRINTAHAIGSLTEEARNDELDEIRRLQPYKLYIGHDGKMTRVPIGDSIGHAAWLVFEVDENVFPPDFGITTTQITEAIIEHFPNSRRVIEMGTGSGYPGIAFAASNQNSLEKLTLVDILPEAIDCAEKNAHANRHQFPRCEVKLIHSDLFENVPSGEKADLIVHNQTFYPDDGRFGLNPDGGADISRRFLQQILDQQRLAKGGAVVMNFADFVDPQHDPMPIAESLGYSTRLLSEKSSRDGAVTGFTYAFTLE